MYRKKALLIENHIKEIDLSSIFLVDFLLDNFKKKFQVSALKLKNYRIRPEYYQTIRQNSILPSIYNETFFLKIN